MVSEEIQFNHPFKPYNIQNEFMLALYETLESKKIGIFESPTGTGKTLSLICSSMTWLREHKGKQFMQLINELEPDDGEPQWVVDSLKERRLKEYEFKLSEWEKKLRAVRKSIEIEVKINSKKVKLDDTSIDKFENSDFLLQDYHSDSEEHHNDKGLSQESTALLNQLEDLSKTSSVRIKEQQNFKNRPQIFFISRTHSQLSQFVGQLRLTKFPPSVESPSISDESIKQLSLGSRKQLCIHSKISKLPTVTQINEACMDTQKDSSKRCPYYRSENIPAHIPDLENFKLSLLSDIHDIEDIAQLGRDSAICPYYGVRGAIDSSEIITLPYQILLQKSARNALSIDLKDSIVIIDEAHNLLDTITSMHSMTLEKAEVEAALSALHLYSDKFFSRLGGSNKIYLAQILKAVESLSQFFTSLLNDKFKVGQHIPPSEIFLGGTGDLINFYRLEKYLSKSKLPFKVDSYIDFISKQQKKAELLSNNCATDRPIHKLILSKIFSFLMAVNNPSNEGKLFFGYSDHKEPQLEYLLLDPSNVFKEIVDQARCVIMAGGTMEPVNDFLEYLLPYIHKDQIRLFNCGHIIPKENLAVKIIGSGPGNQEMVFNFANRDNKDLILDLGRALLNLSSVIPNGMIIFLPSYKFLEIAIQYWKNSGLFQRLKKRKKVFCEPRQSSEVESILRKYADSCIDGGAILFSVVGGKMSEGINFSDNLARAVIMVGLPFPNFFSAEMVAKREYIEQEIISKGGSKKEALEAARDYYENICLRAVNQSIGRAIRHNNDYAVVYLIDKRFKEERIQKKLPNWIRERLSEFNVTPFGTAMKFGSDFFKYHRTLHT